MIEALASVSLCIFGFGRLLSYAGGGGAFQSLTRKVTFPIGGDTVSMDASGTIGVVLSHDDDESCIDSGTVTFWLMPSGQ